MRPRPLRIIPDSFPLLKKMSEKYPYRNPLLSAIFDYHTEEEAEGFVQEYVDSLRKDGPYEDRYRSSIRGKSHPGSHEALAERHIRYEMNTYRAMKSEEPDIEEVLSLWERSLKKLKTAA